jgi:Family of unknown function (DUF6526)
MPTQTYANHRKFVPLFHGLLLPVVLLTAIGSVVNLTRSIGDHQRLYSASLIVVLSFAMFLLCIFSRAFALKAQDRAIRAEENLRHFAMTGKLLDPRLEIHQVIALRFAADDEFSILARRAAEESMPPDTIKRAIKNWKADLYRA